MTEVFRVILRTISENILLITMAMEIIISQEFRGVFLFKFLNEILESIDFRKQFGILTFEYSVEIFASEAGPEVAEDYSVRVEHG